MFWAVEMWLLKETAGLKVKVVWHKANFGRAKRLLLAFNRTNAMLNTIIPCMSVCPQFPIGIFLNKQLFLEKKSKTSFCSRKLGA